jgi:hypothetical protein
MTGEPNGRVVLAVSVVAICTANGQTKPDVPTAIVRISGWVIDDSGVTVESKSGLD